MQAANPTLCERPSGRVLLFVPPDVEEARTSLDSMCGHGALAAAVSIEVAQAVRHLGKGGWINVPQMKAGIERAGYRWKREEKPESHHTAVILVQWTGWWTEPGAFRMEACKRRHWVAARRGVLWDHNWPDKWLTYAEWAQLAKTELVPDGATGWEVWGSLVIVPAGRSVPSPEVVR